MKWVNIPATKYSPPLLRCEPYKIAYFNKKYHLTYRDEGGFFIPIDSYNSSYDAMDAAVKHSKQTTKS